MDKDLNLKESQLIKEKFEQDGDSHIMSDVRNLMLDDAFNLSDDEKINIIQEYFKGIMLTLGLDLNDDSLQGTPYRVAER